MKKRFYALLFCLALIPIAIAWATQWGDYTALTPGYIAEDDDFLLRDVSDTSMGPTGTQKRYLWSSIWTRLAAPLSDDTWQGPRMQVTVGENVAQWDLLYARNTSGNLRWYKYDANDVTYKYYAPRAIALSAITSASSGYAGIADGIGRNGGWGMTSDQDEGKPVYAQTATAGGITLTAPATSGDQVGRVGYVLEENVIMFSLGNVTLVEVQ